MSYFDLRKRAPDPEPEDDHTTPEEETATEEEPTPPVGLGGALLAGLRGPGSWLTARIGVGAAWAVHVMSVWAIGYYGGYVTPALIIAWTLAFAAFIPRDYLERWAAWLEKRDADAPTEGELEAADGALVDPLVTVLWRLIGEAPGVHVKTLAEHLQTAAPEEVVDRPAVRAKLGALGITVKPSVRDARGRVNEGVHRADLQAWQTALPDPVPAVASGARSSPVATAVTCDVANTATAVATPLSRFRRVLSRGGA